MTAVLLPDFADDDNVCLTCNGDGVVEWDDHPELWGVDTTGEANHQIDCPTCGGSGVR